MMLWKTLLLTIINDYIEVGILLCQKKPVAHRDQVKMDFTIAVSLGYFDPTPNKNVDLKSRPNLMNCSVLMP